MTEIQFINKFCFWKLEATIFFGEPMALYIPSKEQCKNYFDSIQVLLAGMKKPLWFNRLLIDKIYEEWTKKYEEERKDIIKYSEAG